MPLRPQTASSLIVPLIAAISMLAGAVLSVLPAMVVALVTLFYNSAGGVLILLGSLINLLPHPSVPGQGGAVPAFQTLDTDTIAVLTRSLLGTILCAAAFVITLAMGRRGNTQLSFAAALCGLGAANLGGRGVAVALAPGLAVLFGQEAWRRLQRR